MDRVSQNLPTVFLFLGIMVKQIKSSSQKQVDISESTIINQAMSMSRFYPIEALIFIPEFSVFPQSIITQIFSTNVSLLLK